MPSKARTDKEQLDQLIREQAKDASGVRLYPESITPRKPDPLGERLTPRQEAILHFWLEGWKREKIARAFFISPATVTTLRKEALRRLPEEVRDRLSRNQHKSLNRRKFFYVPAIESPLAASESGEEDPLD